MNWKTGLARTFGNPSELKDDNPLLFMTMEQNRPTIFIRLVFFE